jgi:hypothetical protein
VRTKKDEAGNGDFVLFFGGGGLHGVRIEFTGDVSGTAVGSIFTGHELEYK